jgi:hypothetical protein
MATKIGPKTVTQRDRSKALVFCVDAANSRSYGGEPTTNLADNDTKRTITHHSSGSYGGTQAHADAPEKGEGWKKVTITVRGSNLRLCQFPYLTQNSKTYTYSVEYDFGELTGYYWKVDGSTGMNMRLTQGQRGKTVETYTNGSSQSLAIFLCHNTTGTSGLNDVIYYRYYQVEEKSHATPFTEGSRTASNAVTNISGVGAQGTSLEATTFETYGQELMQAINHSGPGRKVLKTIENHKGHIGGAYWDFDGTDEHIAASNAGFPIGASERTLSAWVMFDAYGGHPCVVAYGASSGQQQCGIRIVSNVWQMSFWTATYDFNTTVTPSTGVWYYAVLRYNGSTIEAFIDGDSIGTKTVAVNTVLSSAGTLNIGTLPDSSGYELNGKVAAVSLWSSALTAKEIKDIYIAQKGRFGK